MRERFCPELSQMTVPRVHDQCPWLLHRQPHCQAGTCGLGPSKTSSFWGLKTVGKISLKTCTPGDCNDGVSNEKIAVLDLTLNEKKTRTATRLCLDCARTVLCTKFDCVIGHGQTQRSTIVTRSGMCQHNAAWSGHSLVCVNWNTAVCRRPAGRTSLSS
jgi:hypothetical protein